MIGAAALLLPLLPAQSSTATISGTVQDSHHAAVPGARIVVRHSETNATREVRSTEEGDFAITNLPPGVYELRVGHDGFRTHVQSGIELTLGQVLRVEVHLSLGDVAESVNVSTEVALINTEVGAIKGDIILQQEINDMPLDGRDFTNLAFMVSGVVPMAQGGQGSGLNVNGARSDSTNYSVDGFNNRNPRGAAAQVRPNVGAMQEFKMEVAGFSAETGRMAGGNINMVLRSGTNAFHGDVFEFIRNSIFDARSFFDQRKQSLRRNQFGATLLGPVRLPGLYNGRDRTFFMFSWESFREVLGQSQIGNVPTLFQREGDFSQSVVPVTGAPLYLKDPLATGSCTATVKTACFPNNRIPTSRFDPIALRILAYYPLPNRPDPNNNYISAAKDFDVWNSFVWKIDHRFRDRDTMSFRAQVRGADTMNPFAAGAIPLWPNYSADFRSLAGIDHTHLFSPTLLLEARVGYSRGATNESTASQGQEIARQLGISGVTTDPVLKGWPRVTIQDYVSLGSVAGQPADYHVTTILSSAKLTWIKNKHVLKWGADIERVRFNQPYTDNARGTFAFQRNWTNHSVADFLLGMMQTATRNAQTNRNYLRSFSLGAFFNDDYKVTRSLTLNLGLRYELDLPPVEKYGRASNFVAEFGKIIIADDTNLPNLKTRIAQFNLQDKVALARDVGYPAALVYADKINFAPRTGFAWRAPFKQTTVIRGGYGIFYTGHLLNPIRTSLMTGFPFSVNQTFTRLATDTSLVTLSNPFPDSRATESNSTNSNGYDPHPPLGYLQSYNLTLEHQLGDAVVLETGYVGSKGTHLGRQYDINQPLRTLALYQANIAFPRPIAGINTINYYSFGANSNYNAGQISLRHRSRSGFYRFNYTLSKSIDDASQLSGNSTGGFAGAQNSLDLKSERGRSDFDRRHVVSIVYSTSLPFGRGKRFLSNASGPANSLAGGWQFSGNATYYSGQAFTVTSANVDTTLGESLRPNRIGTGIPPSPAAGKRGVDYPWFQLSDFEAVPRCASRTSCEVSPNGFAPFAFGNSGRNILDGPSSHFINIALMKYFRLKERRAFQFRYELFNIFNHANFQLPERQFNSLGGGLITGVTDRGRGGPRVMQAALKFEF